MRELNPWPRHGENWRMSIAAIRAERSAIEVGRRLVALRKALGLKAYEICEQVVVQTNTWSQWEKGKRMADLFAMMRVADRFGADLNYIYMGSMSTMPVALATKVSEQLAKSAPPPDAEISDLLERAELRRQARQPVQADRGEKKKTG